MNFILLATETTDIIKMIENGQIRDIFLTYGIDFLLSMMIAGLFIFIIGQKVKKKKIFFWVLLYLGLTTIGVLFNFVIMTSLINFLVISLAVLFILLHEGEWRKIFKPSKESKIILDDEMFVSKSLYKTMKDLVMTLSSHKTGALITFERHDDLDEFIKEGVSVMAPLSASLLSTIFYVGTPLHDGAVIIRNSTIMAASVFYLPTTRAMNGKFGARHRAALGVSEVSDSVTVVVSEETGRISFAYQGELIPTSKDSFIADFSDLMER